jgi:hypothetical protein
VLKLVRFCSEECQRQGLKSHKILYKDTRQNTVTETIDNTINEYRVLKETGSILSPDDDSLRGVDVIESLVIARSVDDVMHLLLVMSRLPLEEMLRENGFYAVLCVMRKYEDVAEIQKTGCTVFVLFTKQEEESRNRHGRAELPSDEQ